MNCPGKFLESYYAVPFMGEISSIEGEVGMMGGLFFKSATDSFVVMRISKF